MVIKHNHLVIDDRDPFKSCQLKREKCGQILTAMVTSYADGFVLALNNQWGTGKTTFLTMWQRSLELNGIPVCHFNAWENDFEEDPLVPIMAELTAITGSNGDATLKNLLQKAGTIAKNIVPTLTKALAKKYGLEEVLVDASEKAGEAAMDIFKERVDEYAKKKTGLTDFRKALTAFVEGLGSAKPLVFIIDELDRCRPDYAVEVLEQVKHFFSVPGIVFVLGIDKTQLMCAVRGYYGNADINADEYLRRFIDVEYSLPDASAKDFGQYLFQHFRFDDFFSTYIRVNHSRLAEERQAFIQFASELFEHHQLSLRLQEKMYAHARMALRMYSNDNITFPHLLIVLIYVRFIDPLLYRAIRSLELSLQEVLDRICDYMPPIEKSTVRSKFQRVEALVALFYDASYRRKNHDTLMYSTDPDNGQEVLAIQSGFKSGRATETLTQCINYYRQESRDVEITYVMDKIDLLDNFKM